MVRDETSVVCTCTPNCVANTSMHISLANALNTNSIPSAQRSFACKTMQGQDSSVGHCVLHCALGRRRSLNVGLHELRTMMQTQSMYESNLVQNRGVVFCYLRVKSSFVKFNSRPGASISWYFFASKRFSERCTFGYNW
jgi:hypothetical protein